MDDLYTILEVANLLNITTQAVYKRLQQDQDILTEHLTTKGGKKSLTKNGVLQLASLMSIEDPFGEKPKESIEIESEASARPVLSPELELLTYLKDDNKRLLNEIEELKKEIINARSLREEVRKSAEEERRLHEESRMRADTLLMKAMMNQEKPRLLARIFRRGNNKKEDDSFIN